jgi:hypothetical protein
MIAHYDVYKDKTNSYQSVNTDGYIERLKKLRALNCRPSRARRDAFEIRHLPFSSMSVLTKSR